MKDYRKIIIMILIILGVISMIGIIVYLIVSFFFQEERPPLDITQTRMINYVGTYDNVNLDEYGVNFNIRSGGDISKTTQHFKIQDKEYDLTLNIIPFSLFSLSTNDSLSKYESDTIKYTIHNSIELTGNYKDVYNKKRGDIFLTKNNTLIRLTNNTSFKDRVTPVGTFEELSGTQSEIYKIFMDYVISKEELKLADKYSLDVRDKKEGLEYHKYYQPIDNDKVDYDIIGFAGVYNSEKTDELANTLITKTNSKFIEKYGIELNKEEKELYLIEIKKDKNKYFNAITFSRYLLKNNNIYKFDYTSRGGFLEFKNIFNGDMSKFFFKDIEISEAIDKIGGEQTKWNNLQFIIPYKYSISKNQNEELLLLPNIKKYNRGGIIIKNTRKGGRQETIDDVYKVQVQKYITESLSIKNETITNVTLVKSNDISIGKFNGKGNVFKFNTVNGDDFIFIEYILIDNKNYYTIGFSYGENEKELVLSFEELMNSINKIK